jgi:CHAT domain-containing protein/tetratricopeptide (TPR) repeat protein
MGILQQYEAAIDCYNRALNIQPDLPEVLQNKGGVLHSMGQYEAAINCYNEALAIQPNLSEAFSNKGLALSGLGMYEMAIDCFNRALDIQPHFPESLYNKGNVLAKLGRYDAAIDCYDQALAIRPEKFNVLSNKGSVLAELGNYDAAIDCYDQVLKINPGNFESLSDKGNALACLQQYEAAITCYDQALAIQPDYHRALSSKGNVLYSMGQYEAAINYYDQVLAIQVDKYEAWINRGTASGSSRNCQISMRFTLPPELQTPDLDLRGYEGRIACFQAGLIHISRVEQPLGWGLLHWQMGVAHYGQGRFEAKASTYLFQAITEYNLAFTTLTSKAFPEDHLKVLQDAIRAYLGLGDTVQARELREQALAVFRDLLNAQSSPRQSEVLELKFSGLSQLAVDLLVQEGSIPAALEAADRYKNRTLTWMLDTWQETVISPSVADMAALTDDSTALVIWHLSPDALTRFVVLPGAPEPQTSASVQTTQRLETWLKEWDNTYQDYRSKGKTEEGWQRRQHPWRQGLTTRLEGLKAILDIADLEATLKVAGIQRVRLMPHRDLHRLPIHSLFSADFTLTYLPSAQVGLNLQQREPVWPITPQTPLLSIEEPANAELAPLVFAEIESALICQQFTQPKRLAATEATKAEVLAMLKTTSEVPLPSLGEGFRERANSDSETLRQQQSSATPPSLVHFTGHGFYHDRQPRQSALALAGEDQLTVEDIRALSLPDCALVSLAACETAVTGTETIQAEYVGLVSAFIKAGASAVLSTLWTVESVSNAWLMVYFYQRLLAGQSPGVALQAAQQWLRTVTYVDLADWLQTLLTPALEETEPSAYDSLRTEIEAIQAGADTIEAGQPPYGDPYYWAAFVLTGLG